ncbi:TolB family protein [Candidatus Poribacteria bacterium]|nr:TolB family protein [Candidatus Poribacteria bacterium]
MTATRVCGSLTALALAFAAFATPQAWPLEGERIVFGGATADNVMSLYVTTPEGATFEPLTPHPPQHAMNEYPAWSHDGRTIAYSATPNWEPERLYLMDADGSNVRPISDGPGDWVPTWSPHDDAIAFSSGRNGPQRSSVYVADLDTGAQTRLTTLNTVASQPSWRPGGGAIAYVSDREGFSDLHIMDEQGRHLIQLTDTETSDTTPTWHPREGLIAFASWDTVLEDGDVSGDIHTIRDDGSGERRVTDHPAWDYDPQWSPNGAQILFTSRRDGLPALFITDPNGRKIQRVTDERFVQVWGSSWFDAKFPRSVSPIGRHAATWGWLKRLRASAP